MEECGVDPVDCVVGWRIRAVPGAVRSGPPERDNRRISGAPG